MTFTTKVNSMSDEFEYIVVKFLNLNGFHYDCKTNLFHKDIKVYCKQWWIFKWEPFIMQITADYQHSSLIIVHDQRIETFMITLLTDYDEIKERIDSMEKEIRSEFKTILVDPVGFKRWCLN